MNKVSNFFLALSLFLSFIIVSPAWAAGEEELSQRLDRVERIIKGQGLVSLLGRVDQLQKEVQRLNGDNESLRHELDTMQANQRELYSDIEQRLENQAPVAIEPPPIAPVIDERVEPTSEPSPSLGDQEIEPERVDTTAIDSMPVSVENGDASYQSALQTLRSGQYEQAVKALEVFPSEYPQSSYLPNAYYWQGEANYVLRDFDKAVIAFEKVIKQYPNSSKVADATLKLGFSQYENGQIDVAQATLTSVIENYTNTSAARLAQARLDRIKEESN